MGSTNSSLEVLPDPRLEVLPPPEVHHCEGHDHFVQFYEHDQSLTDAVAHYVGEALKNENSAIVIATPEHRDAIEAKVSRAGLDIEGAAARGEYFSLDAAETLASFTVKGTPDEILFQDVVGGLIARAGRGGRGVRAFGEMVALLHSEGRSDAAIRLEDLWNNLARRHTFSLFCAYPMQGFHASENDKTFQQVCDTHSRVIPAESYDATASADEKARTISLLQQKAASLEKEIAERKHAESEMRAEQTKLSMAVAAAQLGVWELDMLTNTLTCSDQCRMLLGIGADDAMSYVRFFELIHPEDRERVREALSEAIADGADYRSEYRVMISGVERWLLSMGRCFHNGAHRLLGVTQDITDRKRAAELLERTVNERTVQLKETIGELEAFSYSVSHDMRSPLRAMQGFAKALLEDHSRDLDPEAVNYLERIQRASARLDLLIRDILTYSKVAKGQVGLVPVDLGTLVADLIQQRPEFESMTHCIKIEQPLHSVLGHEAYLTQCITNLLANALKFVAPGTTPEVRVYSQEFGDKIRVWICDNGVGIAPRHHDRVFQIFGRVYSEKSYEGTGIGLAIVKKAIARMGGEIGFDSEPGRGSRFWFELLKA